MTLAQQIQTLQSRGLIIADTNKAEQALDAISYFRLADYWYHLEADHHTHQFLPNSHFEWRKRSIPTHSEWLYPLTFDAGKGLKEA